MGGGIIGLKVSRPPYDVVTCDPNDPLQTSFYSEWTDVVKVLDGGYASSNSNLPTDYAVTDPGYIPWMECRMANGSTVYDERTPFTWGTIPPQSLDGLGIIGKRGVVRVPGTPTGTPVPYTILYALFNIAVPTQ